MAFYSSTGATTAVYRIWHSWCDGDTGGTSATVSGDYTWITWTANSASTHDLTATSGDAVWVTWTTADTSAATVATNITIGATARVHDSRSPEQRAADEARYAAQLAREQQQRAEATAKYKAASDRARALLLSMLEVHQREQLQRDKYFEVIARHSKRRYRIRQGTHGNVRLLDDRGREVTSYCGQPNGVPTEDCMLAQKLQIEHDEPAFLRAANASRVA